MVYCSIIYSSSIVLTTTAVSSSLAYWGRECPDGNERSSDIHATRAQQGALRYSNY